jgi:hypothetical protein
MTALPPVIASERHIAERSNPEGNAKRLHAIPLLDCFVASFLAMTALPPVIASEAKQSSDAVPFWIASPLRSSQ